MRVLFSVEFAPDVCVDKDGDGICATEDACPEVDGVRTTDPKTNGCPSDRDHDGFIDKEDACPDAPGARTADPKTNGCPTAAAPAVKLAIAEQVTFEPGITVMNPGGAALLESVAKIMRDHPGFACASKATATTARAAPAT